MNFIKSLFVVSLSLYGLPAAAQDLLQQPDQFQELVESSWICDLGWSEPLTEVPQTNSDFISHYMDPWGARCEIPTDPISPFNAGVNGGLIDRLEKVGIDTDLWREYLSHPENLRRFQVQWQDTLHSLIVAAASGFYAEINIIAWYASEEMGEDPGEMTYTYKRHMRDFIARRVREASPADREEIRQLWYSIWTTQWALYKEHVLSLPEELRSPIGLEYYQRFLDTQSTDE